MGSVNGCAAPHFGWGGAFGQASGATGVTSGRFGSPLF
jgi:hypothetical protein